MRKGSEIFGILCPQPMRGYISSRPATPTRSRAPEWASRRSAASCAGEAHHPHDQIEHFPGPQAPRVGHSGGHIVELIAGPFKGEKARVQQIDEQGGDHGRAVRGMISITHNVRGDHVR